MGFDDMFKPYSPEIRGDLREYLMEYDGGNVDNLFLGPKYFFVIKKQGFMIPRVTFIRVNMSPIPDTCYFVNLDFLLESPGAGEHNMSAMFAEKGVYDPKKALRRKLWSIHGLNLEPTH